MAKAYTIKDARGSTIELWGGGAPEQMIDDLSPDELKRFSAIVWPNEIKLTGGISRTLVIKFVALTAFASLVAVLFVLYKPATWPSYLTSVFVAVPVLIFSITMARIKLRKLQTDPTYVETVLALDRCPACLYQLTGQQAEADGCVVCPECSAAWRKA